MHVEWLVRHLFNLRLVYHFFLFLDFFSCLFCLSLLFDHVNPFLLEQFADEPLALVLGCYLWWRWGPTEVVGAIEFIIDANVNAFVNLQFEWLRQSD